MGAIEGSRVEVKVTPNTRGFGESVREYLRRLEHSLNLGVDLIPDLDRYRMEVRRIEDDRIEQEVRLVPDRSRLEKALQRDGGKPLQQKVSLLPEDRELRRDIDRLSDKAEKTFSKATKNGFDLKQSDIRKQITKLEKAAAKADFHWTAELELDTDRAHRELAALGRGIDIADRMERETRLAKASLDRLNRTRVTPAVSLDTDRLERQIAQYRRQIEDAWRIEDPYKRLDALQHLRDVEAKVDLDLGEARRKFEEFQDKHDKIEADLDLKTAGARAHMMSFTRPRSVEIYAKLNTTQAGKILNGMLYGSTGLKGVENQFEKLVNLFDRFDTAVPKMAVLEGALGAVSAGAVNLSRSALGVGASLVSMSKAAMAAPGAIVGLGAAFTVLKHAWGDKGATFSDQIDIASTKLSGLGDAMDNAFYGKAKPAIRDLMNDVSGKLIPGITGIAEAEGGVVEGLADVIRKSYEADELPRIFDKSREAIDKLSPGLQDLVRSFLGLGDATSQYLPRMASYVSDVAKKTADWVDRAKDTGQISLAMAEAVEQGGYLKDSVRSLTGILSGLYNGLAESENGIQGFSESLASADKAVNSYRFQETLKVWAEGAQDAQHTMRGAFSDIGNAVYDLKDTTADVLRDAGSIMSSMSSDVSRLLRRSKTGITDLSSGVRDGMRSALDAIGDAAPAFSSLASMVGQLSRTFGGTFASTLKASAPLIEAVAKGAEATAKAFAMLPQPVQAAIGLYMTFGKAGKEFVDTFKVGMLENTLRTAQWAKQLNELGVTMSGGLKPSLLDVAAGWGAVRSGASGAGKELGTAAGSAGKAVTKMDKLKLAGSGVTSMLAGINPATVALAAVVGTATVAWADYSTKAQATESANQKIADSMSNLKYEVDDTGKAVSNLSQSIQEALSDKDYAEDGWNWWKQFFGQANKFDDTSSAAKQLGKSMGEVSDTVAMTDVQYQQWVNSLFKGSRYMDDNWQAASKLRDATTELRKSQREQIKTTAEQNGWSSEYIDKLLEGGGATEFMALKAKSAAEQTTDYNNATQLMIDTLDRERDARISAANAASSYGRTMSTIGDTIKQVQSLASQGQKVWDGNALSLDLTTEAGRTASDTLTSLASSANNVIDTMIASGASYDEVSKRQQQLQQDLYSTGDQLTNNADGVHQYTDSLLRTPSEIKTKIELQAEQSKATLLTYLSQIEKLFPEGTQGDVVYKTVLSMTADGALTTFDQINAKKDELLQGLKDRTLGIVIDADGDQAIASMETINRLGGDLDENGQYHVSVDAKDLASDKIDKLVETLDRSGLDDKQITMFLNAKGDANLQVDDLHFALQQLGMDEKDINILLNSKGDAPEQMEMVKKLLHDLGASDKQIEWFLNAIDQTKAAADSAQSNIDGVKQTAAAAIKAANETQPEVNAAQLDIDGVKQGSPAALKALNLTDNQVIAAQRLIDSVKQKFPAMLNAVNETDNPVRQALLAISKIPDEEWTNLFANDQASAVVDELDRMIIKDKYFTIHQNYVVTETSIRNAAPGGMTATPGLATGGRISGPGSGTSDSIPAWLSNGEHVIRAASVRKLDAMYGSGFLDYLNRVGEIPSRLPVARSTESFRSQQRAFAAGGRVMAAAGERLNVEVKPVINVQLPDTQSKGDMYVTQNFNQKIVRPADDMHVAASILYRNAKQAVGRLSR